jgi:hypothetical protein
LEGAGEVAVEPECGRSLLKEPEVELEVPQPEALLAESRERQLSVPRMAAEVAEETRDRGSVVVVDVVGCPAARWRPYSRKLL